MRLPVPVSCHPVDIRARASHSAPFPQCLTLQLTINVRENMKWRRNYSNLSTEIIGVGTCQPWKQFLSKFKYVEIFLNFKLCKSPFRWCRSTGFNCRINRRCHTVQLLPWGPSQCPWDPAWDPGSLVHEAPPVARDLQSCTSRRDGGRCWPR